MKLYEFEKAPKAMTDDELNKHMLSLLDEMDAATDQLIKHNKITGNEYVYTGNNGQDTQATH